MGGADGLVLGQGVLPQPTAASAGSDRSANLLARWKTEEVVVPAGWRFMAAAALSSCTLPSCAQAELVKPRAPTASPCTDEFTHQRRICLPLLPLRHPATSSRPGCCLQRSRALRTELPGSPALSSHVLYPVSWLVAFISRSRKVLASSRRAAGDREVCKGM